MEVHPGYCHRMGDQNRIGVEVRKQVIPAQVNSADTRHRDLSGSLVKLVISWVG